MGRGTGWKDAKDRVFKEVGKAAADGANKLADHVHKATVTKEEWQKEKELRQIKEENERAERIANLEAQRAEQLRIKEEREEAAAQKAAEEEAAAQKAAEDQAKIEALEREISALEQENKAAEEANKSAEHSSTPVGTEVNQEGDSTPLCENLPIDGSCQDGFVLNLAGCCEVA